MTNDQSSTVHNPEKDSFERLGPLNPWALADGEKGALTSAALEKWVESRLDWQAVEIERLVSSSSTLGTVEDTLQAYDGIVAVLSATGSQISLLDSVHPEKAIRDKARELAQKVAEAGTALGLNPGVYQALQAMDLTAADDATRHYVSETLLNYRLAGVDKDEQTRARVRALADRATELALTFGRNVQESVNTVEVTDPSELEGLPEDYLRSHPADEHGVIHLTTDFPDMQPVMTYSKSAGLRQRMFLAYHTRAYPQNRQVLLDLLETRREMAGVLGFSSWADLATANQMMGSAANMKKLIGDLDRVSQEGARREQEMVLSFARRFEPGIKALKISDRGYWYEQYRREAFAFDSQSVRPYFPYGEVEKGVLAIAQRLFHVRFEPAKEAAVWDPSVSAWDVYDPAQRASESIGRFYLDMHPRDGKNKWFSAAPLVPGIAGRQKPEAALICNFPGGKPDDPGLLQYSNVVTFFHEFGHLMHAILGGRQQWAGISGIATEGDFVEVPSQMLEEFFRDSGLLASFGRHYQTGEPIPAEMVHRMNRASAFGRADWVRTQLFYTSYSLLVHDVDTKLPPTDAVIDLDGLLEREYKRLMPYEWVSGNRMYSSFTHLIGYSSNYYTYMFDKVIALDFFGQFDLDDLIGGKTAMRYRQTVLEPGGSKPGKQLIRDFLGRDQSMEGFERWIQEEFASDPA